MPHKLTGLKSFLKDHQVKKALCVCRTPRTYKEKGVEFIPWQNYIETLYERTLFEQFTIKAGIKLDTVRRPISYTTILENREDKQSGSQSIQNKIGIPIKKENNILLFLG